MTLLVSALRNVATGGWLSRETTRDVFSALLDEELSPAVAAAFLAALAIRGETAEELAGVVDVLRARVSRPPVADRVAAAAVDVCGTGGDGLGTFNISTVTAFVVAGAGVPVAKHGGRAVSSACGSADVLSELGVRIEMPAARAAEALERAGVTFLFAPAYHPVMRRIAPLRRELGIRTVFNLAGPLSNPVGVRHQIVGVDRPERVAVVAAALAALGTHHALVLSNESGGDELLPVGESHVAEVRNGALRRFTWTAGDFGLPAHDPARLRGGTAAENAALLTGLLEGARGAPRDTVLMNAAAALLVAGRADSPREGVERAAASIDSGAARAALAALVTISSDETPAEAP